MDINKKIEVIRVGALGAARITPRALLDPAGRESAVEAVAIASRSRQRAAALGQQYGIPTIYETYRELLADSSIDAVYIALPNALHAEFTVEALRLGKHVLCEKPLASNHAEALLVEEELAKRSDLVMMEAYHWRYHPIAADILRLLPLLGPLRNIHVRFSFPLLRPRDIRWKLELAGGAMMDVGCYALSFLRLIKEVCPKVIYAKALTYRPEVDRRMDARLLFPDGTRAALTASMLSGARRGQLAVVEGEAGRMTIQNPFSVHRGGRLSVEPINQEPQVINYPAQPTTYQYQLRAFADAVQGIGPNFTTASAATEILGLIDDIYEAAGLRPRPSRLVRQTNPE